MILKTQKSCSNCIRGNAIPVNRDILCSIKGAVSPNYVCSRHKYMPEQLSYKERNFRCYQCENFVLSGDINFKGSITVGLCKLFSVRQFDGRQKNACSKFKRKLEAEVV